MREKTPVIQIAVRILLNESLPRVLSVIVLKLGQNPSCTRGQRPTLF